MLSATALVAQAGVAQLMTIRGVSQVAGEDVLVDVLYSVPDGADAEQIGHAALEAIGARPFQSDAFSFTGLFWDQFSDADAGNDFVTQYYNPANDATGGDGLNALLASQDTWNAVAMSTFSIVYEGETDRLPSLVKESPGRQTFDGFNDVAWMALKDKNTLGVTWSGTSTDEADMALNTKFAWSTNGGSGIDAETVFLHENGHVAGLGHTDVTGAVMEPVYAGERRMLHADDIAGITALYPSASTDPLPTVSITGLADGDTVVGMVTLSADADDDDGVVQVEFFIDGQSVYVGAAGPYTWDWYTVAATEGLHTLTATVTDTAQQTSSDSITVTVDNVADPIPTNTEMYVWDITWTEKRKGPNTDLRMTIDVNQDTHTLDLADSGDDPADAATVAILLVHDTNNDGFYGGNDASWTGSADTNGQGLVTFKLGNAPTGNYQAVVTGLTHTSFVWNSALDENNPSTYEGLPGGTEALEAAGLTASSSGSDSDLPTGDNAAASVDVIVDDEADPVRVKVKVSVTPSAPAAPEQTVRVDTAEKGGFAPAAGPTALDLQPLDAVFNDSALSELLP